MTFLASAQALTLQDIKHLSQINKKKVDFLLQEGQKREVVMVTLSTQCPCSVSHLDHLSEISEKFKERIFIVGLHSDLDTTLEEATQFFEKTPVSFQVFYDEGLKVSRKIKAITTPHVFYFSKDDILIYQGALTSSHTFRSNNKLYLYDVLKSSERPLKTSKTKPLGCFINYL